jgi:hypothetical protein
MLETGHQLQQGRKRLNWPATTSRLTREPCYPALCHLPIRLCRRRDRIFRAFMNSKIRPIKLKEFLTQANAPTSDLLPLVHSTASGQLFDIFESETLMASSCKVFKGEELCYLFMGRPAYKLHRDDSPSEWQLPAVFVLRFPADHSGIKRIFPFDSGAFSDRRLPAYITCFNLDNYNIGADPGLVGKIFSIFFEDHQRYLGRRAVGIEELKKTHILDPTHQEISALARLYLEHSGKDADDRAAAIEVQMAQHVPLTSDNVLGIVMPEEYGRVPGFRESIAHYDNVRILWAAPFGH